MACSQEPARADSADAMGSLLPFVTILLCLVPAAAQADTRLRPPAPPLPEVVLTDAEAPTAADYGLGDGGVNKVPGDLQFGDGDSVRTPGGVLVECRAVGVKLTFPSRRELLVAADGFVHLRSQEGAGPFPSGIELRLGDGALVRITLAPSSRQRVQEVVVVAGEQALQPWRNGGPASLTRRPDGWAGPRLACCGDGGDLYRPIALGPLLVLDRVLVAADRAELAPRERLVVLTAPLLRSLTVMQRQHREANAEVRRAITAVAAVADRGRTLFPTGAALARAEADRLRWLLPGGAELELDLDADPTPRLQLFAGSAARPMIEWTLRADAAAFLANPRSDQPDKRWHGNGTRLDPALPDLQARQQLFEFGHARQVIERLRRPAR